MGVTRRSRDNRTVMFFLVICLLLAYAYNRVHHIGVRAAGINPALAFVRDLTIVPLEKAGVKTGNLWHECVVATFRGSRLAQENDSLKTQISVLEAQNSELASEHDENTRLREMLGFSERHATPMLPAQVLALKPSPLQDAMTIDRGVGDGVEPHGVVVSPSGDLVGQVIDSTNSSSDVILISDQQSSVGAQVSGKDGKPWVGICEGTHSDLLTLTYLPINSTVQPGDRVTTSGLGGVYPKGLPIGTVVSVTTDNSRSMKSAAIRPDADLNQVDEAFVLMPSVAQEQGLLNLQPAQSASDPQSAPANPG